MSKFPARIAHLTHATATLERTLSDERYSEDDEDDETTEQPKHQN
jgi:hypothetical protein